MRRPVASPRWSVVGVLVLLVAAVGSGDAKPDRAAAFETIARTLQEGLAALKLDTDALHPRHDFIPSDKYRLALIEDYLQHPADVARKADERFSPWVDDQEQLARGLARAFATLGRAGVKMPEVTSQEADLYAALVGLYELEPGTAEPPARKAFDAETRVLPRAARDWLAELLRALREVVILRRKAFARLTTDEWITLRKFGSQFNTGMPPSMQVQYLDGLHARIDVDRIYEAALHVALRLERIADLRDAARKTSRRPGFHLVYDTPVGRIEFGGWKSDRYEEDCLLTVDFGGDDTYAGSAGGSLYTPQKTAIAIDLAGDDRYESSVGLAQGSGMYGVGALVDCAGDDVYISKNVSQGTGHVGVGLLWDLEGRDTYRARSMSQGAALQGVGWLRDDSGDDRYELGWMGQGFGSTLGFGILQDRQGRDAYRAGGLTPDAGRDPSHFLTLAQGHGQGNRADSLQHCTSGGIGLLADQEGDDAYVADVFGQGCAYWYALGLLLDARGDDTYEVFNYGQGGGFHMAVGVLMDYAGGDRYAGQHHAQGHALDRSVAWCVDFDGDDVFRAASECQGCAVKPHAVGFFADMRGDDRYVGGMPAYVRVPVEGPDGPWPKAFFMDLAGRDAYEPSSECDAADGRTWTVNGHGRGVDR